MDSKVIKITNLFANVPKNWNSFEIFFTNHRRYLVKKTADL